MSIDVMIIGGGLAGLTAATYLAQNGVKTMVIEKQGYPKHKVCGEYVSNEVLPFLNSLDFDPFSFGAKTINKFLLTTIKGKIITANLPLGGFSLSRFAFDAALAKKAQEIGVTIIQDAVIATDFNGNLCHITTKKGMTYTSKILIGAYGKRSNLDKHLKRKFIDGSSSYLAVKAHYKGDFQDDLVALHNFKGGYCGLSKVENNDVNACYIADYKSFKKYNGITDFQKQVLYQNPHLKTFFENASPVFEKPLSISQLNFSDRKLIEGPVLMCGDSAGLIHPLCGNGMSMAIQSAQLLSSFINKFLSGKISSRRELETSYQKAWNKEFKSRLRTGRFLARLFELNNLSNFMLSGLSLIPSTIPKIIERTHGKPLTI